MDKQHITAGLDSEDRLVLSRLYDLAQRCLLSGAPMFSAFLSPRVQQIALARIHGDFTITPFGGYEDAERKMLRFAPPDAWEQPFPICAVQARTGGGALLSHRDFLGAALGLGLTREAIGDIAVDGDCAIYFCTPPACKLLLQELKAAGRCPLHCAQVDDVGSLAIERKFEESTCTVSSMRLDCVVGAVLGKSRSLSAGLIEKGLVAVNYEVQTSCAKQVPENAVLSVRGYGKMQVVPTGGVSKKGRVHLLVKKYV